MTWEPTLAVVDLDGVVADVRHRLHHVNRHPKDWGAFFAAAPDDPPLPEGLATVRRLAEEHVIVYLSGRPEHCRRDTMEWFTTHDLPTGELFLRRYGDFRPARVMKVEMLGEFSKVAKVAVLVDDDEMVVEAARAAGYSVLHADWMADSAALLEAQEVDGAT
jgi:hypothetical protein